MKSRPLRIVVQQDPTGCAVASAAFLAGVPYKNAKHVAGKLGIFVDDPGLWSETNYIRHLLAQYKINTGNRKISFRSWDKLPDRALLSIKWHMEKGKAYWHWVVFVREGDQAWVHDSKKALKQHRRTDFGRMKPRWYIPVSLP